MCNFLKDIVIPTVSPFQIMSMSIRNLPEPYPQASPSRSLFAGRRGLEGAVDFAGAQPSALHVGGFAGLLAWGQPRR